jgi:hypothetical protein
MKKQQLQTRTFCSSLYSSSSLTCHSEHADTHRNLKIRDQPITEDETEAQQAMNNMASQLRMVRFVKHKIVYMHRS